MAKLIKIKCRFTDSQKQKILRSVGASISENLLYSVRFGKNIIFALCENQLFWHSDLEKQKADFECYEAQGKIERNKNLLVTVSFEDRSKVVKKRTRSYSTMCIKNELVTRRFILDFVLTDEEKQALKYFFESYFKEEPLSENFKMPKEKFGRIIRFQKQVFGSRADRFFSNSKNACQKVKSPVNLTDSEERISIKKDVLHPVLNCVDFFADAAFLFAVLVLLKACLFTGEFNQDYSYFNIFVKNNVLKIYCILSISIYFMLKLIMIAWSKYALKLPCILIIVIQAVTLLLLKSINSSFSIFCIFALLNTLLYFCFQMLAGNVFTNALKKFLALCILWLVVFLALTVLQTLSDYSIEWNDFCNSFVENLTGK